MEKVPAEHLSRKAEKDQLPAVELSLLATVTMSHPTRHWQFGSMAAACHRTPPASGHGRGKTE